MQAWQAHRGPWKVRRPARLQQEISDFGEAGFCPQQGGQIRLSGGGGRHRPGSFAKPISERPDQPLVVFGGAGQPEPEGQRAAFCGVSYLDLPL